MTATTTIIENPRYKRQLQQEKLEEYNARMNGLMRQCMGLLPKEEQDQMREAINAMKALAEPLGHNAGMALNIALAEYTARKG